MPTKKPRLMLSVDAALLYDLETLAMATRKPIATVAGELLQDIRPRMLDLAREISTITLDRARAHAIAHRIDETSDVKQRPFTFSERVRVTGIRLSEKTEALGSSRTNQKSSHDTQVLPKRHKKRAARK
jgi:hypothetical protein